MSFWPIRSEIRPAFDGGLLQSQFLIGGVHVVQNKTQRNSINLLRRKLDATTTTLAIVLDDNKIYRLINNPSTNTTTDSDWSEFTIGETSSFRPIGEWDADNDNPVLQDTGALGLNGQFYFVTNAPTQRNVTYTGLFGGTTETVVNGDLIVSVGDKWIVVTSSVNWDAIQKPSAITDYVNGIVIAHTHTSADITDLAALLDAKYDVDDTADHLADFVTVPDTKIVEVEFLRQHYYTSDQVDDIVSNFTVDIEENLIVDTEATLLTVLKPLKTALDVKGLGQITVTNGSAAVTGSGTSFTATGYGDVGYWYRLYVKDSAGNWYIMFVDTITNDTSLTVNQVYNRAQLRAGYQGGTATFPGVSGTYDYWVLRNWSDGLATYATGNGSYADDYGFAFGGSVVVTGQTGFASGLFTTVTGSQGVAFGANVISTGAKAFAGGWGSTGWNAGASFDKRVRAGGQASFNWSQNLSSQIGGHGALATASAILGGQNHNIPATSTNSAIIGGDTIKVAESVLNTLHTGRIRMGLGTNGAVVTDNTNNDLVVRDATTGELEIRTASTLTTVLDTYYWKLTGTSVIVDPVIEGKPTFSLLTSPNTARTDFITSTVGATLNVSMLGFRNDAARTVDDGFADVFFGPKNGNPASGTGGNIVIGQNNLNNLVTSGTWLGTPYFSTFRGDRNIVLGYNIANQWTTPTVGNESTSNIIMGQHTASGTTKGFSFGVILGHETAKNISSTAVKWESMVAIGTYTLRGATFNNGVDNTRDNITAIGPFVGYNAVFADGFGSTLIGNSSGRDAVLLEDYQVLIGGAGRGASLGRGNIGIGERAFWGALGGSAGSTGVGTNQFNVAVGIHAMEGAGPSEKGTYVGCEAGQGVVVGQKNTGYGSWSLPRVNGHHNMGIGPYAGYMASATITGSGNAFIGPSTGLDATTVNVSNVMVIANPSAVSSTGGYRPVAVSDTIYVGSIGDILFRNDYAGTPKDTLSLKKDGSVIIANALKTTIGVNNSVSTITGAYNFLVGLDMSISGVSGALVQWANLIGEAGTIVNNKAGTTVNNAGIYGGYLNNITSHASTGGSNQFGSIYNPIIVGAQSNITNEFLSGPMTAPMVIGYKGNVQADLGQAMGYYTLIKNTGRGGFAHGFVTTIADFGNHTGTIERVTVGGLHAINMSANSPSQTVGHGAYGDYSAIIGGYDHNIPADSPRSAILGGNAIKARAADPDNVYVPYFNIVNIAQNDLITKVLVRDESGKVYWRDSATIGTGASSTDYWRTSGATTISNPTLTGSATFTGSVTSQGILTLGASGQQGRIDLRRSFDGGVTGRITQETDVTRIDNIQGSGLMLATSGADRITMSASLIRLGVPTLRSSNFSHTLTAGASLDVRGTGTTTNLALRIADSNNAQKFSISDEGAMVLSGAQGVISSLTCGGVSLSATGSSGITLNAANSGNVTARVNISGQSSEIAEEVVRFTREFKPTSGVVTHNFLNVIPTWNTTGTYAGTVRGIYYNPTVTSLTGATHIAFENTSGQIRFGAVTQDDTKTQIIVKDATTNQLFWKADSNYWKSNGNTLLTGDVQVDENFSVKFGATTPLDEFTVYATGGLQFGTADDLGGFYGFVTGPLITGNRNFNFLDNRNVKLGIQYSASGYETTDLSLISRGYANGSYWKLTGTSALGNPTFTGAATSQVQFGTTSSRLASLKTHITQQSGEGFLVNHTDGTLVHSIRTGGGSGSEYSGAALETTFSGEKYKISVRNDGSTKFSEMLASTGSGITTFQITSSLEPIFSSTKSGFAGAQYAADYSASFVDLSLVHKGFTLGAKTFTGTQTFRTGAAGAGTAPFKLVSGTLNTTAENGAFEYQGNFVTFTHSDLVRQKFITMNESATVGVLTFPFFLNTGSLLPRLSNSSVLYTDGSNIGIGASPGTAARLDIRGSGTTSSTYGLKVSNSSGTENFRVADNGFVWVKSGFTTLDTTFFMYGNVTSQNTYTHRFLNNSIFSSTNGIQTMLSASVNASSQSGTAGWTALQLEYSSLGTGTGKKKFINCVDDVAAELFSVRNTGDTVVASTAAYYLGDPDVDGTWRIIRSGDDLVMQQREGGTYNTKSTISGV